VNFLSAYYLIRPFIPRRIQIGLRRRIAVRKRRLHRDIWPIDPKAGGAPENWTGWPDQKKFALILGHDVDTAKGHGRCERLMDMERRAGFRSSFNFVAEGYRVSSDLRRSLTDAGFEVGLHGLRHDGSLFLIRKTFDEMAPRVNSYLKDWGASGFYSPAMYRNVDWISEFDIEYSCSTFDTDPFEPQPNDVGTVFPLWIEPSSNARGYIEIPYTLPQDHLLFSILRERTIKIWSEKLDWIAKNGGMVRLNTHPDYMNFGGSPLGLEEYPASFYREFLEEIKLRYEGQYWHVLPRDLAQFWKRRTLESRITDHR
jgi:peptidoglycan/xylan/chitin deacetylase (PgdA/CDA1 family)